MSDLLTLRYSDTGGETWHDARTQEIAKNGDYRRSYSFLQLGIARDRVFEISWTAPRKIALNGGFVQFEDLLS